MFLDEVQLCKGFEAVLNGLNRKENLDIYVTGSNSKFFSSDVLTEFRGRGDEVRVYPLSFSEYISAYSGDKYGAWIDYYTYGGLPLILSRKTDELKSKYLIDLCKELYLKDIEDRYNLRGDNVMATLVNILASAVGSLTNPTKLANTFRSNGINVSDKTIGAYIVYLMDAFFISKAERYDIRGKKYIASPFKYYFTDVGLRNAQLNFRQQEEKHIMENIIFNELMIRECSVDIGIVYGNEKNAKGKVTPVAREIDFIATSGGKKTYIQSAYALGTEEKAITENKPFALTGDSFPKIIVRHDIRKRWYDDNGILNISVIDFLLDDTLV